MPRPKKTEAEINAMREKIIDITLSILEEDGPDAISSRAIAKRLGMAHMSIFTYFKNQAEIHTAAQERIRSKWQPLIDDINTRTHSLEDIPLLVQDLLDILITFARHNPNMYRLVWAAPDTINKFFENSYQPKLELANPLASLVQLGIQQGIFKPHDPLLAANTVLGIVNMPFILFYTGRIVDPDYRDRMVEEVLSIVMQYLKISPS